MEASVSGQNVSERSNDLELPTATGVPMLRGLLSTICILGIAFNFLVICKRTRGTNRQASTTRIALRLLCFQTIADTISLVALLIPLSIQYVGIRDPDVMAVVCKIDLFLIHSSSAFSIWCWLIMSAVRYYAIYKPYAHLRLNKEPMLAVALVVGMCTLFELWILYDVTYIEEIRGCAETLVSSWGTRLQVAEIAWSYFLPLIIISILDIRVLCCHSVWSRGPLVVADSDLQNGSMQRQLRPNMSGDPICEMKTPLYAKNSLALSTHSVDRPHPSISPSMSFSEGVGDSPPTLPQVSPLPSNGNNSISLKSRSSARGTGRQKNTRRQQQMRILKKFLVISILDLSMNLPNYLLRLYITVVPDESLAEINSHVFTMIQDFSQLLYFGQFALNSLYYLIFTTGPNKKQKKSSGYTPYHSTNTKSAA
ncbi:G-PROTEIN-RECEP-F1-2 domain-containing protein [Aphelenchoides besseyi]|nr:G-PROTEIN-RECEP-F1-2 domain-containing protein [Aphelenchoides besseyi]